MKRIIILLSCLLAAVSCTLSRGYQGYYFTYDAVDLHEAPSDASPVIMKATCDWRPKSYDEKTAKIPYAFFLDDNRPTPIGIRKVDETGKWGWINEKFPLIYDYHGWVKLSSLIPLGPADNSVPRPTYETIVAVAPLYKHPKVNEKDKLYYQGEFFSDVFYKLKKGDKAQLITRKNSWGFVRFIAAKTSSGKERIAYGWVPMSSLKSVGDIAYADIQTEFQDNEKAKTLAKSKNKGKVYEWGVNHWSVISPIICTTCRYGALAALIIAVLFLIPAIRRRRWMGPVIVLPLFAAYLFVIGYMSQGPGIMFGLAVPVLLATALYPLLYLRPLSRSVGPVIRSLGIIGSIYVMFIVEIFTTQSIVLHAILFLVYASVTVWFSRFIAKKYDDDVCPNCGFYAGHDQLGEEYLGTSSKTSHSSRDVFDHSETSGNVTTNYYRTETSSVTTHKDFYSVGRCCARCGYEFENEKVRTRKEFH